MATNGTTNGTSATNGHSTHNIAPKITFYTNHRCPWAQRAAITLDELNLPYEEVIIDLDTPRPQWYLDINPRGLVPSIKYSVPGLLDEEIITESAVVSQFLADAFPSHLLPASKESPTSALFRARVNFFNDTWSNKVAPFQFQVMRAQGEEKDAKVEEWVKAVEKEIEPLLAHAKPFFGGSEKLTLAEVLAAPFLLRWNTFINDGELLPKSLGEKLGALPNFSKWQKAVIAESNVRKVYDEEAILAGTKKKLKEMAAKK